MTNDLTMNQVREEMARREHDSSFTVEVLDVLRTRGFADSIPHSELERAIATVQGQDGVPSYLSRQSTVHPETVYSDMGTPRDTGKPPADFSLIE